MRECLSIHDALGGVPDIFSQCDLFRVCLTHQIWADNPPKGPFAYLRVMVCVGLNGRETHEEDRLGWAVDLGG